MCNHTRSPLQTDNRAVPYFQTKSCRIASRFPCFLRWLEEKKGCCARSIGHEHDFCQAQKPENTDPRTNYAVKYATARGHLKEPWDLVDPAVADPVRQDNDDKKNNIQICHTPQLVGTI